MTATSSLDPVAREEPPVLLVDFAPEAASNLARELHVRGVRALPVPTSDDLEVLVRKTEAAGVVWNASATNEQVRAAAENLQADLTTATLPIVVTGLESLTAVDHLAESVVSIVTPQPAELNLSRSRTILDWEAFQIVLAHHLAGRAHRSGVVALLDIAERLGRPDPLSSNVFSVTRSGNQPVLVDAVRRDAGSLEVVGLDSAGRVAFLMRDRDAGWAARRLSAIAEAVVERASDDAAESIMTPVIGWTALEPADTVQSVNRRLTDAVETATARLDLRPVRRQTHGPGRPNRRPRGRRGAATLGYLSLTILLGVVIPFASLVVAHSNGVAAAPVLHAVVATGLFVTSVMIWAEGWASLRRVDLPAALPGPAPPATAIIAAYLPNEAATILETLDRFRSVDYPDLQIVLAYNTSEPVPVEAELARVAAADPRVVLLPVAGSTSKAQNVNAALGVATGAFVGIFDADHHPAPDAFQRAARWMAAGYDVVQGRCVVRNGFASLVAQLVAVEFETIYGVSHPGRTRLHGFGIFGGSNGYWRRSRLHQTRLQEAMLTEDIDSSIRLVTSGGRIVSDSGLVSRELSPVTWDQLWHQRLRWAQGWFQVSRRHLTSAWDNPRLTRRQRLGMAFLIGWREVNPWLSQLMIPLLAFQFWRLGPSAIQTWEAGVLLLATVVTMTSAPAQLIFAWRGAGPDTRRRTWFVAYGLSAMAFYTEWRNLVARVAQLRELFGESEWTVTPRR